MKRYFLPVGALALALLIGAGTFVVHAKETRGDSKDKGEVVPGGAMACVDMERIYDTSGGPEALGEQARLHQIAGENRIRKILAVPMLDQNELQEYGTLIGKDKPTPEDETKITGFKAISDQRAEEFKTLQTKNDLNDKEKTRLTELTEASRLIQRILPGLQSDFHAQQEAWVEAFRHEQYARLRVEVGKVAKEHNITHVFDTNSLVYSANDLTPMLLQKLSKRPGK